MPTISKAKARSLTLAASRKMLKVAMETKDISPSCYKKAIKLSEELRSLAFNKLR